MPCNRAFSQMASCPFGLRAFLPSTALPRNALRNDPVEDLLDTVFLRFLTRRPTETRTRSLSSPASERLCRTHHSRCRTKSHSLAKENTGRVLVEPPESGSQLLRHRRGKTSPQGDPPSNALSPAWRERMEDALWAVINSPEILFIP